jgi:hypothetical protein
MLTNEYEETEETTEEVDVNETDYETDSETEGDATETKAPERTEESLEDKRARLERQLAKVNKKLSVEPKGESKESKESSSKSETGNLQERLDRQELKIAGITDKKEQAEVLSLAKKLELDVEDAVSHPAIKAVLKDMRNKAATPSSSTRTSSGSRNEVEYWASQTLKGQSAPTAEMRTKVREYLAKNKK